MVPLVHFLRHDDTSGLFTQLARRHDRRRYRMRVATLEGAEPHLRAGVEAAGVPVDAFGARSKNLRDYGRTVGRLARFLRRHRVQVLHTHFYYSSLVGGLAGALARVPVRVVTRHHADYHWRSTGGFNRHVRGDQLVTRLHHRVIAISASTARQLIEVEGAPPGKVVTIPNGLDFESLQPGPPGTIAALRREWGHETNVVLVASRLAEEKGVEVLLRALPVLRSTVQRPFHVVVAGTGPLLEPYQRLLAEQGNQELVSFLGFRRDLPTFDGSCRLDGDSQPFGSFRVGGSRGAVRGAGAGSDAGGRPAGDHPQWRGRIAGASRRLSGLGGSGGAPVEL